MSQINEQPGAGQSDEQQPREQQPPVTSSDSSSAAPTSPATPEPCPEPTPVPFEQPTPEFPAVAPPQDEQDAAQAPDEAEVDAVEPEAASEPQSDAQDAAPKLRIPSAGELALAARDERVVASRIVWGFIASEVTGNEHPLGADNVTQDMLDEAIATLGMTYQDVRGHIDELQAAKGKLSGADLERHDVLCDRASKKAEKMLFKAAEFDQGAAKLRREAQELVAFERGQREQARSAHAEAYQVYLGLLDAGAPGDIDYGLRTPAERLVIALRPCYSMDGKTELVRGDVVLHRNPSTFEFAPYAGEKQPGESDPDYLEEAAAAENTAEADVTDFNLP